MLADPDASPAADPLSHGGKNGLACVPPPAEGGGKSVVQALRERIRAFRTARVASPAFQRWAAGFPLTRRIAQKNTRALFDLCAGFVYSQVLFACIRLDLFRTLRPGPLSTEALARRVRLSPERAERLFKAAASLDLITRLPDGRWVLADLGAALIGNPSVGAMIEHHALLYADLADPVALLRGESEPTQLSGYWPYAKAAEPSAADAEAVAGYSRLMAASQALIAEDVLDAYPLDRHACLMDVGGGEGAFLTAAAAHHPTLRLMLFDLPAVAARARTRLDAAGLTVTCQRRELLLRTAAARRRRDLPGSDRPRPRRCPRRDASCARPTKRCPRAARCSWPSRWPARRAPSRSATRISASTCLAMGSGRARTAEELCAMLRRAGFTALRSVKTRRPLLTRLIVATKSLADGEGQSVNSA